jgi:hypothetical protein
MPCIMLAQSWIQANCAAATVTGLTIRAIKAKRASTKRIYARIYSLAG